jgi:hypothetical protein
MLAAGDVFVPTLTADGVLNSSIQTTASVEVDIRGLDSILFIRGDGQGAITIDLSQLPASVVNLQVGSFQSVTLVGSRTLDYLVVSDADLVNAGQVSIGDGGQFRSYGVKQIKIDVVPAFTLLAPSSDGKVDKTLLEFKALARGGALFSSLQSMGLLSSGAVGELNLISSNSSQTIMLNFQPDNFNVPPGINAPSQVSLIRGDFTTYFLASPAERARLEQTLLVARQAAVVNLVPLATLLNKPAVQAVLTGENPAIIPMRGRILADAVGETNADSRPLAFDNETEAASMKRPATEAALNAISAARVGKAESLVSAESGAATRAERDSTPLTVTTWMPPAPETTVHRGEIDAFVISLMQLNEPFARMVAELRHGFASFGDLAAAHLNEQMQVDRRAPLLVDTQGNRSRSSEVRVVTL